VRKELYVAACAGGDACLLTANGLPTSPDFETGTRLHEERHAADTRKAFDSTIAPWDDKLTAAQRDGTEFTGPLPQVGASLWGHMGGTPEQTADAYAKAVFDLGQAFHASDPHPQAAPMNARATAPDCSTAEVDVAHVA
jgi:hypothetical protein